MTGISSDPPAGGAAVSEIRPAVDRVEKLLGMVENAGLETARFSDLGQALYELHARMRTHHAVGVLATPGSVTEVAPQYVSQLDQLREEHSMMIGMLDRAIRMLDTLPAADLEDKLVFAARVRELIAVIRRHETEEDRVLYLAFWRDIGGES